MNLKEQLKKSSLLAVICIVTVVVVVGCGQQGDQEDKAGIASDSPNAAPDHTDHSRFTPIKPDMVQASAFNYKVYEFAADDLWISIVPMPPKSGDVVVRIDVPGNYDVKLTNEKCASAVNVTPSMGDSFALTAADPKHKIAVNKGMQLKIAMPNTALNNYFCNVAVAAAD